ncbi:uncharacterized protein V6R79_001223 [Siganus canaliculatus]
MASLGLLLLCTALIHAAQSIPAVRGWGRGLDGTVGGAQHQRVDVRKLLPYEAMMSQGGGGANNLYYGSDDWRGQGLDQALQRLVERDQRREHEEEQRAAYLAALLRLLTEAESTGLVGPGDVELVEEEEEEEDQGPQEDFQGPAPPDYDETGRGLNMGRPAAWWGRLDPQLAQALLTRAEPRLAQTLLDQVQGRVPSGGSRGDEEALRRLVARLLSSIGPAPSRRMRRDLSVTPVGPAHRRTRRSLDNMAPPLPSNAPPLLRVKRLEEEEEEEEKLRPPFAELQRMKRIDTMATAAIEELNHGNRRRRRREVLNYDPQVLINHMVEYMRE